MEFLKSYIYKAAIDYVREKSHQEIVGLLSKGPIKASKAETEYILNYLPKTRLPNFFESNSKYYFLF